MRQYECEREQQALCVAPKTPAEKVKKRKKPKRKEDNSPTDSVASLATELRKCRLEMEGPYLDREENRKLRQQQRQARA